MKYLTKRKWKKRKMRALYEQYLDKEFTKRQLEEIKEGMRQQRDRLVDQVDGASRRLCELKYTVYYSETGDKVSVKEIPLSPADIEKLPDKPSKKYRFHKKDNVAQDQKEVEAVSKYIEKNAPYLKQMEQQLQDIERKINGPLYDQQGQDQSMAGALTGLKEVMELLKKYKV